MIPTAALRQSLKPKPIDPDSAAYNQAVTDTVEGILWLIDARLSMPISHAARAELQHLSQALTERTQ
jgi:hypothetical protein